MFGEHYDNMTLHYSHNAKRCQLRVAHGEVYGSWDWKYSCPRFIRAFACQSFLKIRYAKRAGKTGFEALLASAENRCYCNTQRRIKIYYYPTALAFAACRKARRFKAVLQHFANLFTTVRKHNAQNILYTSALRTSINLVCGLFAHVDSSRLITKCAVI